MWQRIYELKNQGMETSRLERVVVGNVDDAAKVFTDYDRRMPQLAALWNRLYTLDFTGYEGEYQQIYSKLKDPFAIEEITAAMNKLEAAVIERQKAIQAAYEEQQKKRETDLKRYNLEQVIMSWKSRGYKTDELEALLNAGDLDKCREAVAQFETNVKQLWEIGKRLQAIDYRGLEAEYNEIRVLLSDASKVEEARTKLDVLEKKVAEKAGTQQVDWQTQMAQRQQWEDQKRKDEQQKLQEEARKAAEVNLQAQKAQEEWEAKLAEEKQAVAKARLYLSKVAAHMKESQPEYSPSGFYLGDNKWTVNQDLDKLEVVGKVNLNIFQEHLIVLAHFMSAASLPQVSDLVNYFKISGDKRKADKQYLVDCIIMNRVSQPSIDAVTGFSHTNCAALLYDIAEDKIYFNQKDVGADAYAGYFQLNSKPKPLAEIFKPVADKFDVYYAKDIVANFGMSPDEVDKMLKHLTSQNKIFPVEIKKKSFSFA
jgi:chemotaxis protein histidine kinase CheA